VAEATATDPDEPWAPPSAATRLARWRAFHWLNRHGTHPNDQEPSARQSKMICQIVAIMPCAGSAHAEDGRRGASRVAPTPQTAPGSVGDTGRPCPQHWSRCGSTLSVPCSNWRKNMVYLMGRQIWGHCFGAWGGPWFAAACRRPCGTVRALNAAAHGADVSADAGTRLLGALRSLLEDP
jgi:hypothetical protein